MNNEEQKTKDNKDQTWLRLQVKSETEKEALEWTKQCVKALK